MDSFVKEVEKEHLSKKFKKLERQGGMHWETFSIQMDQHENTNIISH